MRRSTTITAAIAALLTAPVVAAPSASAAPSAPAAGCTADGGDPDGFTGKTTPRTITTPGKGRYYTVDLRAGYSGGGQYAWARAVDGPDSVWLDVSQDSGATWTSCGERSGSGWTHGFKTSPSTAVRMRACAAYPLIIGEHVVCTPLW